LPDAELPHSSSPEKRKKRSALRGGTLEPLQHEAKATSLREMCSSSLLADQEAKHRECKDVECRQHELKKSDSVPKLPRVGPMI